MLVLLALSRASFPFFARSDLVVRFVLCCFFARLISSAAVSPFFAFFFPASCVGRRTTNRSECSCGVIARRRINAATSDKGMPGATFVVPISNTESPALSTPAAAPFANARAMPTRPSGSFMSSIPTRPFVGRGTCTTINAPAAPAAASKDARSCAPSSPASSSLCSSVSPLPLLLPPEEPPVDEPSWARVRGRVTRKIAGLRSCINEGNRVRMTCLVTSMLLMEVTMSPGRRPFFHPSICRPTRATTTRPVDAVRSKRTPLMLPALWPITATTTDPSRTASFFAFPFAFPFFPSFFPLFFFLLFFPFVWWCSCSRLCFGRGAGRSITNCDAASFCALA